MKKKNTTPAAKLIAKANREKQGAKTLKDYGYKVWRPGEELDLVDGRWVVVLVDSENNRFVNLDPTTNTILVTYTADGKSFHDGEQSVRQFINQYCKK